MKIAAIGEGGAHVFAWGSCHACLAPTFSALDVFAENIPSYLTSNPLFSFKYCFFFLFLFFLLFSLVRTLIEQGGGPKT